MTRRSMHRTLPLAVAALVAATACGGGGSAEKPDAGSFSYGSGDAAATTTTTTTVAPEAAKPGATRSAAATTTTPLENPVGTDGTRSTAPRRSGEPDVPNRSVRLDQSGLELTLVVADKVTFASTEDITFEVSFVNRTDRDLYRNGAQSVFFEMAGETKGWSTATCQPDFGGQRPPPSAIPIEPGQPNRFVGTYPAEPRFRTRDACRLPPGEYDVTGLVDWCPPETITRPGGGGQACDSANDVSVRSAPIRVTIT